MNLAKIFYTSDIGAVEIVNTDSCPFTKVPHDIDERCPLLAYSTDMAVCADENMKCICRRGPRILESDVDMLGALLQAEIDLHKLIAAQKERAS